MNTPTSVNPTTDQQGQQGAFPLAAGSAYRGSDGAMTCALCECEMDWQDCTSCGGDGYFDGYEEDPNWYAPGEDVPCSQCGGNGGDFWCPTRDCKTLTCVRVIPAPNTSTMASEGLPSVQGSWSSRRTKTDK